MMEAVKGIDFIVEVNGVQIGGQQGATLNRSKEAIEATTKDSNGWKEVVGGIKEWGIDADGLVIMNDTGYAALENSFMNDTKLEVALVTPSGTRYKGEAIVADFPLEAGFEDMATYSITLEGSGALKVDKPE